MISSEVGGGGGRVDPTHSNKYFRGGGSNPQV